MISWRGLTATEGLEGQGEAVEGQGTWLRVVMRTIEGMDAGTGLDSRGMGERGRYTMGGGNLSFVLGVWSARVSGVQDREAAYRGWECGRVILVLTSHAYV